MKPANQECGRRRIALAVGLVAWLGLAGTWPAVSDAEDQAYLRSANGTGESRLVGEVEEYTGEGLVFRHRSGRVQTFGAARVARIESQWSAAHQLARDQYRQGAYQESLGAYLKALRTEQRKWVQRQQLARITWCCRNLGNLERAASAFLALYRSDRSTVHFAAIPLVWTAGPVDAAIERRAGQLLADATQPAAQLIGASWLLTTARRGDALQVLRTLSNADDARIIFLAAAQSWRTQLAGVTADDVQQWESRIDSMPFSIRAGPYFLLGSAHARSGDSTAAALALMRVRINFPDERALSAASMLVAGEQLAADHPAEAREVYREVLVEFADTPAAATARQRHAALSGPAASGTDRSNE